MARFLKNPQLAPGATAAVLPIVPSSAYGDSPVSGLIRFNQTSNRIEFYYNGSWNQVAKIGTVSIVPDTFTGDGTTTQFTMSQSESSESNIIVTIGGVYQVPVTHYTVSANQITFSSPPPAPGVNPNTILVIHNFNSTNVPA
jgi:hypothetical protein